MYYHGLEQAAAFAAIARDYMARYHIPETPDHYELWYAYATGAYVDLKQEIDRLIEARLPVTVEISRDLRRRYLSDEKGLDALSTVNRGIHEELDHALQVIEAAGGNARDYGATLKKAAKALKSKTDLQSMTDLVRTMVRETNQMVTRAAEVETELASSSREITQLKTRLDEASEAARTDMLTKIANRRGFDEFLAQSLELHEQTGENITLIMGDVDHFKRFNDTWGHQMGDQVLRLIASCIKQHVPEAGLAARYGGEEFAVVLRGKGEAEAARLAEKIRSFVAAKSIKRKSTGESVGRVTVSFGVAQCTPLEDPGCLIARADEALYEAKSQGRNRVARSTLAVAV